MSTKFTLQIICLSLLALITFSASGTIDWTQQSSWGDDCGQPEQSPIDIDSRDVEFCDWAIHVEFEAPCMDFEYVEEGQSLTAEAQGTNYITFWRYNMYQNATEFMIFEAAQLHYHRPSEHTINGMHYDLEMHLVHAYSQNLTDMYMNDSHIYTHLNESYAVIGILFKEDHFIEEDVFDTFLPGENETTANILEAFECIADRFFYHYEGSLTTPPCVEIVEWFVMRDPLPIRPENLERFVRDLNNGNPNSRDTQPLNNRTVWLTSPTQCYKMGQYDDDEYMDGYGTDEVHDYDDYE